MSAVEPRYPDETLYAERFADDEPDPLDPGDLWAMRNDDDVSTEH